MQHALLNIIIVRPQQYIDLLHIPCGSICMHYDPESELNDEFNDLRSRLVVEQKTLNVISDLYYNDLHYNYRPIIRLNRAGLLTLSLVP